MDEKHSGTNDPRLEERLAVLQERNARLELALRLSNAGMWDLELSDGTLRGARMNAVNMWEALGYAPPEAASVAERMSLWHPDDVVRVQEVLEAYLGGRSRTIRSKRGFVRRAGSIAGI